LMFRSPFTTPAIVVDVCAPFTICGATSSIFAFPNSLKFFTTEYSEIPMLASSVSNFKITGNLRLKFILLIL